MSIKRKIFSALAALALAGGIAATAVHTSTASADGPVVVNSPGGSGSTGSPPPCTFPFNPD
jgi:hypothetical protein